MKSRHTDLKPIMYNMMFIFNKAYCIVRLCVVLLSFSKVFFSSEIALSIKIKYHMAGVTKDDINDPGHYARVW